MGPCDTRTCFKRFLISEPFHFKCGISHGNQTTFKVRSLSFSNSINVLKRLCKYRTLSRLWLLKFGPLEWRRSLKLTNLLKSFWALRLKYNITFGLHSKIDRRGALSQVVYSLDCILSSIFRNHVSDVQSNVPKIKCDMEARGRGKWLAIVIELNAKVRIMQRLHLSLKVSSLPFKEVSCAPQLSNKARWGDHRLLHFQSTRSALCLQFTNLSQTFRMLRFEVNTAASAHSDLASVHSFTQKVGSLGHVSSRVISICIQNIKCYITKIMCGPEAVACLDRYTIHKPFYLQVWIIDWFHTTFQMSMVTFL